MTIVTILTDFGSTDSYVAQMKGVILQDNPDVEIVDISHNIPRHSIVDGAFVLESAVPYFRDGTIHVAVVDPGVGSRRRPIVIECKGAKLVGPDNGLLERAADKLGIVAAYKVGLGPIGAKSVSRTFHGRDIFARTAALLASGRPAKGVGPRISPIVKLNLPEPTISKVGLECLVLHVDTFGNIITNLPNGSLPDFFPFGNRLRIRSKSVRSDARMVRTYSDAQRGELVLLKGSQGYFEVAVREKSASEIMRVTVLDRLRVSVRE